MGRPRKQMDEHKLVEMPLDVIHAAICGFEEQRRAIDERLEVLECMKEKRRAQVAGIVEQVKVRMSEYQAGQEVEVAAGSGTVGTKGTEAVKEKRVKRGRWKGGRRGKKATPQGDTGESVGEKAGTVGLRTHNMSPAGRARISAAQRLRWQIRNAKLTEQVSVPDVMDHTTGVPTSQVPAQDANETNEMNAMDEINEMAKEV